MCKSQMLFEQLQVRFRVTPLKIRGVRGVMNPHMLRPATGGNNSLSHRAILMTCTCGRGTTLKYGNSIKHNLNTLPVVYHFRILRKNVRDEEIRDDE